MGIFDSARDKANEFLSSEEKTDDLLDKAAEKARSLLGEDKAGQINKVRDSIDERIGGGDGAPEDPAR